MTYQPADAADSFSGRYLGAEEGTAVMFGDSKAMDEVVELALPGVLAVNTRGSWTVAAVP